MPHIGRPFGTGNADKPGLVRGSLLNQMANQLNNTKPIFGMSYGNYSIDSPALYAPTLIGVAKITEVTGQGKYLCKLRYLDGGEGKWAEIDSELPLDTNGFDTQKPSYALDDFVTVKWDQHANCCIPLYTSSVDQTPYANLFSREQRQQVPSTGCKGGSHDAVHLVLERFDQSSDGGGNWKPLLPELIIRPDSARGGSTGSIPVIVSVRDGDMLRLRYGTSPFSRSQMYLEYAGLSIQWIGRIHTRRAVAQEPDASVSFVGTEGFATVKNFYPIALSVNMSGDSPTLKLAPVSGRGVTYPTPLGDEGVPPDDAADDEESGSGSGSGGGDTASGENIGITMKSPSHEWLGEVTIYAHVTANNLTHFAKVGDAEEADSAAADVKRPGDLLQANSNGFFSATLVKDYKGTEFPKEETATGDGSDEESGTGEQRPNLKRNLKIWLAFIDRWGKLQGKVFPEQGMVYGPVHFTGFHAEVATPPSDAELEENPEAGSNFETRPVYATTIEREEYYGKYSGNKNKGESADVRLYSKVQGVGWKDSGYTLNAVFDFNKYKKETFCVVVRGPGGDVQANQIECSTDVSNSPQ